MSRLIRLGPFFSLTFVASLTASAAADMAAIAITAPAPHQVYQRQGHVPQRSGPNESEGAALGFADVLVRGSWPETPQDAITEYRLVLLDQGAGRTRDWTPLPTRPQAGEFSATLRIAAGGWYRLELRARQGEQVCAQGAREPFGVGDLFLVAGQSYATNCNDVPFRVADAAGRVVAFDAAKSAWRVAHDPQPVPDGSTGGSIWPPLGDLLVPLTGVPVGFANVAVGATSSAQWMPAGELHQRLVDAGRSLGRFRAVLWQQGESDVIGKVATQDYVANLQAIRGAADKAWGFEPPWLLAKSTLHPTVYTDPAGEARIRRAIDELCRRPGFRPGPDTDILTGENRGGPMTRRHFSAVGQRRAALLWFAVLWRELSTPCSDHESVLGALPE